jgi:hypothetical protein
VDENPEVMILGASMLLLDQPGKTDSAHQIWPANNVRSFVRRTCFV